MVKTRVLERLNVCVLNGRFNETDFSSVSMKGTTVCLYGTAISTAHNSGLIPNRNSSDTYFMEFP